MCPGSSPSQRLLDHASTNVSVATTLADELLLRCGQYCTLRSQAMDEQTVLEKHIACAHRTLAVSAGPEPAPGPHQALAPTASVQLAPKINIEKESKKSWLMAPMTPLRMRP